jgi:hypothetical protein
VKTKLSVLGLVLVLSTLIASGCTPSTAQPTAVPTIAPTEPPTEVPTATPTEAAVEVPDPARARDAALHYVSQNYSEQAPAPNLAWVEETITPEGLVGSSTFQYTADDWVVTVSFPVVAPQATIYSVVVANQATGFQWEGDVDAAGQVTEQAVAEGADVAYEGVSFSYDDALAAGVVAETVPAVGPAGPAVAEWEVEPEHVRFSFDGYILPETFHEPRIVVYPVSDFEATSEIAGRIIAALRRSLAEKPTVPEATPLVPPFNAGQLMRTQLAYVDFQNGTGMRFLTQLGQAYAPINNHEVFYAFQGITHDGQYYVAAILPASHPTLPTDGTEIPGSDYGAFAENFQSYASDVEQQLDAQDASSFTPDLSLLDAMIQSLKITNSSASRYSTPGGSRTGTCTTSSCGA